MGIIVLIVGLIGLTIGLVQHLKAKRILAAPFKKTGDLAKDPTSPDPKGLISTEGQIHSPTPLLSPCSQTPCLYYEVEVIRHGEKTEMTQDGSKTEKKKESVEKITKGVRFTLDDGSGPIWVDSSHGGDFDNLTKKFSDTIKLGLMIPGELAFGAMRVRTPSLPKNETTVAFEAVEKIVPADGKLFALGKIDQGTITKPGWRSMMFSSKGREGLLASTAKTSKIGFIAGGVATVAAIPLMLFGPSLPSGKGCPSKLDGVVAECTDTLSGKSREYRWSVKDSGEYRITVTPPAGKKFPLQPRITVEDSTGREVASVIGGVGSAAELSTDLTPGSYSVVVKDAAGVKVKGGFSYTLAIGHPGAAAPAVAANAAKKAPANPAVCEDGEEIVDARTCKLTLPTEDGASVKWTVSQRGQYTLMISPFGPNSVRKPVLTIDGEEIRGKGSSVVVTRVFNAGEHSLSVLDFEVPQESFPLAVSFAAIATPAPGKVVAQDRTGGKVVPAGAKQKR